MEQEVEVEVGKQPKILLEGENLFDDCASVVAFGVLVKLAMNSQLFQYLTTILRFLIVMDIGLKIGEIIGVCVAFLSQR